MSEQRKGRTVDECLQFYKGCVTDNAFGRYMEEHDTVAYPMIAPFDFKRRGEYAKFLIENPPIDPSRLISRELIMGFMHSINEHELPLDLYVITQEYYNAKMFDSLGNVYTDPNIRR